MLYLCLVLTAGIVLEPSVAKEPSCPVCSHYDYEERLLERVIRNELALKDTLEKITETNAKVDETLKKIENENSKLNHAIHALEAKKSSLDVKVDAFIVSRAHNVSESVAEMKAAIKSLVVQTTKELGVMKDKSLVPLVMFHARLNTGAHTFAANQNISFKTVIVNEGGGYGSATGHFTASVAGVYMFMVQYCAVAEKVADIELVHNGRPLQRSQHKGGTGNSNCASMQALAKVSMADKVWVRVIEASEILQEDTDKWNTFSGFLIRV